MKRPMDAVWHGLRLRCPACGQGRIYHGLLAMQPGCSACGVVFEGSDGEFVGGIMLAYAVTAMVVAAGVLLLVWLTDLSATVHLVIGSVFAAIFLVLFYRNFKGLWLGIAEAMGGLERNPTWDRCPPESARSAGGKKADRHTVQ